MPSGFGSQPNPDNRVIRFSFPALHPLSVSVYLQLPTAPVDS